MEKIIAKAEYNERNIRKLALVLDKSFNGVRRTMKIICCVFVIVFIIGVGMNNTLRAICLAGACMILGSINHQANTLAKETIKGLGGRTLTVIYEFFPQHITVHAGKNVQNLKYTEIIRLIDDKDTLYLCPSPINAFMVSCSSIDGTAPDGLKKELAQKTGLEWQRPDRISNYNVFCLIKKIKKRNNSKGR